MPFSAIMKVCQNFYFGDADPPPYLRSRIRVPPPPWENLPEGYPVLWLYGPSVCAGGFQGSGVRASRRVPGYKVAQEFSPKLVSGVRAEWKRGVLLGVLWESQQ